MLWRMFQRGETPEPEKPLPFDAGGVYPPVLSMVTDGVDYSQPPVVPYYVPRDAASVRQFIESKQTYTDTRATYRHQFDGNRSVQYDGRVDMPLDDPLEEWDWATRKDVLTNCHAAYHRNPLAKATVDLTRRFVIGKGHTVIAQNQEVQAVIDEFRANPENNVYGYDRTFIQDLQVDGELFIQYFVEDGQVVIAQVPPWFVKGVTTEAGFFRRIRSWELEYTQDGQPKQDSIPGGQMLHIAINNHGYELRGRPDLFVILPWLRAYNEWLVDRARQNKWRNALLWLVKVASRVPGAVAKMRAVWRVPPPPGSTAVVPEGVEVEALSNPVGAGDASEDGRQIKLNIIVGVGLPEYMMADGQNANLASASAQQLPALWKFTDGQELMTEQVWTPIYRTVIQAAVDAGRLPAEVPVEDPDGDPLPDADPILAVDAFKVSYYELQSDDPLNLAQAFALLTSGRISSIETAREKLGLDNHVEEKRLEREESAMRDRVAQGREMTVPGDEADNGDQDTQTAPAQR